MKYYVYMVKTSRGYLYTGISTNPYRRVEEHNSGIGAKCLVGQRPVKLVWKSSTKTKSEALKLEAKIKKLSHDDKVWLCYRQFCGNE